MQATANVLQMTKATTQGEVNVTHILSLEARVPIILFAISFFRQIRQLSRSLRVTPSTFRNMECVLRWDSNSGGQNDGRIGSQPDNVPLISFFHEIERESVISGDGRPAPNRGAKVAFTLLREGSRLQLGA